LIGAAVAAFDDDRIQVLGVRQPCEKIERCAGNLTGFLAVGKGGA
jgi:hypothetical protein